MRVWLIDEKRDSPESLEVLLRQLESRSIADVELIGVSAADDDSVETIGKLAPDFLDVVVIHESSWPATLRLERLAEMGVGILVVVALDRLDRYVAFAQMYAAGFIPTSAGADQLAAALATMHCQRHRDLHLRSQIERLEHRLSGRITIERAKGILMQRLSICEAEAYRMLRNLSRRQRRQMRDIAQALLASEILLDSEESALTNSEVGEEQSEPQGKSARS